MKRDDFCRRGQCRVACLGCGCTVHLDEPGEFPLCEECVSDAHYGVQVSYPGQWATLLWGERPGTLVNLMDERAVIEDELKAARMRRTRRRYRRYAVGAMAVVGLLYLAWVITKGR